MKKFDTSSLFLSEMIDKTRTDTSRYFTKFGLNKEIFTHTCDKGATKTENGHNHCLRMEAGWWGLKLTRTD